MFSRPQRTPGRLWRAIAVALASAFFVVAGAVVPAHAADSYSISGIVYLNGVSVQATTGDVVVEYTRVGESHVAGDEVELEADGSYTITGLPDLSSYYIYFRYTGTSTFTSTYYNQGQLVQAAPGQSIDINSADRADVSPVLWISGSISGEVTVGTVDRVATAGEVSVTYRLGSGAESAAVLTDAAGGFSFSGLPRGTYTLTFRYLGSEAFQGGSALAATGGTYTNPVRYITLQPSGTVSGIVSLGSSSTPAGVGAVTVSLEYYHPTLAWQPLPGVSAQTDALGYYSITHLATQQYRVVFDYDGTDYVQRTTNFTVVMPGSVTVNQTIAPAYTVSGHVNLGSAARSATAAEVRVTFTRYLSDPMPPVYTDAAGNYSISGLAAGNYTVTYEYVGSGAGSFPVYTHPGTSCVVTCRVSVISDITSLDVTMPQLNEISGLVTTGASVSLAGVSVYAQQYDLNSGAFVNEYVTTTASDGSYGFVDLPNGDYSVYFEKDGYSPQAWDGLSYYYLPSELELAGADVVTDIDATMYLSGSIQGTVTGPGLTASELSSGYVYGVLYVVDYDLGEWVDTGDGVTVSANGTYTLGSLFPDQYLFVIYYDGPRGIAAKAIQFEVEPGSQTIFNATLNPVLPIVPGTLVKGSGSTIYLANGYDELVPLAAFSSATDAGISASYRTVPDDALAGFEVATAPLSSVVTCDGDTYISTGGTLKRVDAYYLSAVANLPTTALDDSFCTSLPTAASDFAGPLYLASSSGGAVYKISPDGVKMPVAGAVYPATASSVFVAGTVIPVSSHFLGPLPLGSTYLEPGMLLKTASSPTVYLVDGASTLVPISSLDTARDLGFDVWRIVTVAPADIAGRTISATPLQYVIQCDTVYNTWMGSHHPSPFSYSSTPIGPHSVMVNSADVAGLAKTVLSESTCVPRFYSSNPSSSTVLIRTLSSPTLYYLNNGVKQQVLTMASAYSLAGTTSPVITTVGAAFLASIPEGAALITPGMLVKSASSPTVYLVNDATHFVAVRTIDSIVEMGLPGAIATVSAATISGATLESTPVSNFVTCSSAYYVAANGMLNKTDSATVGAAPVTPLTSELCAMLAKNNSTEGKPLFVKSPVSPTVYLIAAGQKKAILSGSSLTRLAGGNPVVITTVNAAFLASVPAGADVIDAGMLVKASNASTIYLVTDSTHLVPIATFDSVAEMGLPTGFITVSPATVSGMTAASTPLSNVVDCAGTLYLAAQGKLWPTTSGVVGSLPVTVLTTELCALLPKNASALTSPVFVKSPASPNVFAVTNGVKQKILSGASLGRLAGSNPVVILTVNAAFLASVPAGADVIDAGMLVKASNASTIYLVTDSTHLVPIATFDSVAEMGLPTGFITVSPATVSGMTAASTPLSNVVDCAGTLYLAAQGKLWPTTSGVVGSLPVTVLTTELCALLPKNASALTSPVFVKSPASPNVFAVTNGVKQKILSGASLGRLAGSNPVVILTVNAAFLASVPAGADVIDAGMLVKASNASTIYLVTDSTHLVPIATFDSVAEMGLPTGFITVSPATVSGMTAASTPLSNVVDCAGTLYLAAQGKLWPTTSGVVGSLPVTVLTTELCALLPKNASALTSPVFVKSPASPTVYALNGGVKRAILSGAGLAAQAAGNPVVILTVNGAWLTNVPTGAVIP